MSSEPNTPASVTPESHTQSRGPAVPIWLIILLFLLLYWGALYFDKRSGWFSPKVYAPFASIEEVQALQPGTGGSGLFEQGKAVYNRHSRTISSAGRR
jgi:hypothetical protein